MCILLFSREFVIVLTLPISSICRSSWFCLSISLWTLDSILSGFSYWWPRTWQLSIWNLHTINLASLILRFQILSIIHIICSYIFIFLASLILPIEIFPIKDIISIIIFLREGRFQLLRLFIRLLFLIKISAEHIWFGVLSSLHVWRRLFS